VTAEASDPTPRVEPAQNPIEPPGTIGTQTKNRERYRVQEGWTEGRLTTR